MRVVAQIADPEQPAVFLDTAGCAAMAECRSAAEAITNSGEAAVVVGAPVDLQLRAVCSVLPALCVLCALPFMHTYCIPSVLHLLHARSGMHIYTNEKCSRSRPACNAHRPVGSARATAPPFHGNDPQVRIAAALAEAGVPPADIGAISPYRAQVAVKLGASDLQMLIVPHVHRSDGGPAHEPSRGSPSSGRSLILSAARWARTPRRSNTAVFKSLLLPSQTPRRVGQSCSTRS